MYSMARMKSFSSHEDNRGRQPIDNHVGQKPRSAMTGNDNKPGGARVRPAPGHAPCPRWPASVATPDPTARTWQQQGARVRGRFACSFLRNVRGRDDRRQTGHARPRQDVAHAGAASFGRLALSGHSLTNGSPRR
jgi:hypothetical protein